MEGTNDGRGLQGGVDGGVDGVVNGGVDGDFNLIDYTRGDPRIPQAQHCTA